MAGGLISGYNAGVSIAGAGTVANQGVISTGNTKRSGFVYAGGAFTATTSGVLLGGGGVSNAGSGLISSYLEGVVVGGGGSVVNAGTILGSSTGSGIGVVLPAGGSVTNAQSGVIYAGLDGVLTFGRVSTVINQGSIYALDGLGVDLTAGGLLSNASGGEINGYSEGVLTDGSAASTIINSEILYGYRNAGGWLKTGGSAPTPGPGTSSADISASRSPTVPGRCSTRARSSVRRLTPRRLALKSAGVQVADGGVVTNAAGGVITSKWMGVQIGDSPTVSVGGSVVNYGTILAADGNGDGAGVWLHGPGAVTNAAGGVISGGGFGIVAYYQTTVVNQGTVSGAAYAFDTSKSGFADRIIDLPGGVFYGTVSGGNTLGSAVYSTLELAGGAGTGPIVNAGTFIDFGRIALDAGATWSVGGSIVAGETIAFGGADASLILTSPTAVAGTITGFAATDTIVLSGITDVTGLSFGAGNTLTVAESGGPGLALPFVAPQAVAYSVGAGQTDIYVPCFLAGTHILTDRGEVLVEKLAVGDRVATLSGGTRRLCWIGHGRSPGDTGPAQCGDAGHRAQGGAGEQCSASRSAHHQGPLAVSRRRADPGGVPGEPPLDPVG